MTKTITRKLTAAILGATLTLGSTAAFGQGYTENFDNIGTLPGSGWVLTNNSAAVGSTGWFQGNNVGAGGPFDAYNGAANAYIGANYNNTGSTGTISNFLITPNRTFRNGDVFTFYTRKPSPDSYADRLEVRLSTNGASTAVGAAGTGVGDFTTLLLSINPTLVLGVYPTVWTQYTITISGLPAPTSGRIAFRYFVTGAGLSGSNSDYIGIDNVVYTPYVCPSFTLTTGGALTGATAGSAYSTTLTQTGALGAPSFAITAGALPPGLTLSAGGTISGTPTATGTFNFTVTVSDNSGCSGSQSYSITSVCPANPITFVAVPALCSNDAPLTLTSASPAGGSYSGTGVSGGTFDPAAGTQTVTYDYTDPYGCSYNATQSITVNTAPTVTQSAVAAQCSNGSALTLSGGSPAGGTYSGTGVNGGDFDPAVGTQTLNYAYTDANGCSNDVDFTVTVNTAPTVTHSALTAVCSNAPAVSLSGGSPAGGSYTGTGVSGGNFDPSVGTQTITYSYTDANGCTESADVVATVNTAPTVTLDAFADLCSNSASITLGGGSPAGGSYSGTGVSGGSFDPAAGSQTITYTFTDANGCTDTDSEGITVNTAPTASITALPASICVYSSSIALTATPAGGTFSGSGVSSASFDPATAGVGATTITYNVTDANGCSDEATISATVSACAGVEENAFALSVNVYPNPSDNGVNVSINMEEAGELTFKVYDMQGKLLVNQLVGSVQGQYTQWLDLSTLAAGTYQLALESAQGRVVKQIIKR